MSCVSKILLYQMIKNPIVGHIEMGYGADEHKTAFPRLYAVYLALNTKKIYYCETDGVWTEYTCDGEDMIPVQTIEQSGVANTVAAGSPVTVATYQNNVGKVLRLSGCIATGNLPAEFELYVDTNLKGSVKMSEQNRNAKIVLPKGIIVQDGSIVTVKVTHQYTGRQGDYKATIYGYRYTGD